MTSILLAFILLSVQPEKRPGTPLARSASPDGRFQLSVIRSAESATIQVEFKDGRHLVAPSDGSDDDEFLLMCLGVQPPVLSMPCRDFEYDVVWSKNGEFFVIVGGAHKFWWFAAFRISARTVSRIQVPDNLQLVHAIQNPAVPNYSFKVPKEKLGVIYVSPGIFAIDTYGIQYRGVPPIEGPSGYVVLDFTQKPVAKILGAHRDGT
jgi:hypothetical protein